jgi:hypothetical protein
VETQSQFGREIVEEPKCRNYNYASSPN